MNVILDWFKEIGTFLEGMLNLVVSICKGMGDMARLLLSIIPKIPHYFAWLPDGVLYLLVATFGIAICYKILGREG